MKKSEHDIIRIIAIDPGKTVGWAVMSYIPHNKEMCILELGQDPDYTFTDKLKEYIKSRLYVDLVVIEKPPERGNDYKLVQLYGEIKSFTEATGESDYLPSFTPMPGLWKPYIAQFAPDAKKLVKASMRHARDSVCMGVYSIMTKVYNKGRGESNE